MDCRGQTVSDLAIGAPWMPARELRTADWVDVSGRLFGCPEIIGRTAWTVLQSVRLLGATHLVGQTLTVDQIGSKHRDSAISRI